MNLPRHKYGDSNLWLWPIGSHRHPLPKLLYEGVLSVLYVWLLPYWRPNGEILSVFEAGLKHSTIAPRRKNHTLEGFVNVPPLTSDWSKKGFILPAHAFCRDGMPLPAANIQLHQVTCKWRASLQEGVTLKSTRKDATNILAWYLNDRESAPVASIVTPQQMLEGNVIQFGVDASETRVVPGGAIANGCATNMTRIMHDQYKLFKHH